jgi:magnesium transporter
VDDAIIDLLKEPGRAALRQNLDGMNIVDIAEELEELADPDVIIVFRMLSKDKAAEVFAFLAHDVQQWIIEAITDREIGSIINELFLDDAVDFVEEMPSNVVKRVLANVTPGTRNLINQFLQYPEDSAGSIMTIEYVNLKSDMTVNDAFVHIRETGMDKETIYTSYVTDKERKLIGAVSAKTLFLSKKENLISDVMEPNVISAYTHDDKEALMNSFRKYGFIAMPVIDKENRLVGIVTFDDALLVQEEEATEDFERRAAMSPSEDSYLKTGVFTLSKNRIPWLLILNLAAVITGMIVERFEYSLAALPVLVTFVPMLMDTGGNAGSQTSTLIIRGMALNEIRQQDFLQTMWKELRVALSCGGILVVVNFARLMMFGHEFFLAVTVSLTLYGTIILAKSTGAILPFFARVLRLDPALMAAPLITTIVDAVVLIMYFSLAGLILQI